MVDGLRTGGAEKYRIPYTISAGCCTRTALSKEGVARRAKREAATRTAVENMIYKISERLK